MKQLNIRAVIPPTTRCSFESGGKENNMSKANAKAEGNKKARKTVEQAVETYHKQREERGKKSKRR